MSGRGPGFEEETSPAEGARVAPLVEQLHAGVPAEKDVQATRIAARLLGNADFAAYASARGQTPPQLAKSLMIAWNSGAYGELLGGMQLAAADVFHLSTAANPLWQNDPNRNAEIAANYDTHKGAFQGFIRAQYDQTQATLRASGITQITLYRSQQWSDRPTLPAGIGWNETGVANYAMRPLSSWSSSRDAASIGFGYDRFQMHLGPTTVPASRILSVSWTGMGARGEREAVVLGGLINTRYKTVISGGNGYGSY